MIEFITIRDLYREKIVEHDGAQYIENVLVKKGIKVPWLCVSPSQISEIEPYLNANGTVSKTKTLVTYQNTQKVVLMPFRDVVEQVSVHGHNKTQVVGYGTINSKRS